MMQQGKVLSQDGQKKKEFGVILSVVGISFIQGLQYAASPVLGAISAHYPQVGVGTVQMLLTVPGILAIAVALLSGRLVTKVSKKQLLITAGLLAGITGFLPFLSDSFTLLFVSRVLYGIPLGLATALNSAVVAEFFTGEKRTRVMGIQAASVGAGIAVVTSVSGMLGAVDFHTSYFINIIGFISFAVILLCLPETGKVVVTESEPIRLNRTVFIVALFGFLEFFFLMTFTTNIAMHLSGKLAGSSAASGWITGVFSAAQIAVGLVLGNVTKLTKKMTLPAAMLCFCAGGVILILFSGNLPMLMAGAVLCGFSQGIFLPTAYVDETSAVNPASASMASAVFTSATCLGQLLSPTCTNAAASALLGSASTTHVYTVAAVGMALSAVALTVWKNRENAGHAAD
ncbi:MAG: MFS transporter [Lachnospiraceae bacterium]|jgi:MFS family permease|nr:MFS transporter [Lachnospiraceae bacterium]